MSRIASLVIMINEIIGLSAAIPSYRATRPDQGSAERYQELWLLADEQLTKLRDEGIITVPNPNPHRTLAGMWAWIWSQGGSGKQRIERPARLYAELLRILQTLERADGEQSQLMSLAYGRDSAAARSSNSSKVQIGEEAAEGAAGPTTMPKLRLFISHASEDAPLAAELIGLVRSALNLDARDIRCTSVDGYRLPGGADTNQQLRKEVHAADGFLGIVSDASMRSLYVLFE